MADQKILDRIKQLLAMAADTTSPHEAAIAAGRARKLMDLHQVELEDLKEGSTGFGFIGAGPEYRYMPEWQGIISIGVAKLNDCKVIKQHKWQSTNNSYSYQILFQGYESDVQCAKAIYEYLLDTVTRLCGVYIRELGYTKYPARIGDPYKRGAAVELQERMKSMAKERLQDTKLLAYSTGTSLVVYKMQQVEAEFGAQTIKMTRAIRNLDGAHGAYHRGREDGKKINIHRQIES